MSEELVEAVLKELGIKKVNIELMLFIKNYIILGKKI